jgi:hypothetical protein
LRHPVLFGLKIAPDSIDAVCGEGSGRHYWEFAMGVGPNNRSADNVLPSPHGGGDEFFDDLRPALEEVVGFKRDESAHQETNDLLLLLEENARLRKLAVQLSNILGDLPPFTSPATPQT